MEHLAQERTCENGSYEVITRSKLGISWLVINPLPYCTQVSTYRNKITSGVGVGSNMSQS